MIENLAKGYAERTRGMSIDQKRELHKLRALLASMHFVPSVVLVALASNDYPDWFSLSTTALLQISAVIIMNMEYVHNSYQSIMGLDDHHS